jgi:hypothetical protein
MKSAPARHSPSNEAGEGRESEREPFHRLRDRLWMRLAERLAAANDRGDMENQTERIHRLLLLWLDLQQAVRRAGGGRVVPWESKDKEVARIWREITDPKNRRALEEWLFQVAPGQLERWALQALQESRR